MTRGGAGTAGQTTDSAGYGETTGEDDGNGPQGTATVRAAGILTIWDWEEETASWFADHAPATHARVVPSPERQ